MTDSRLHIPLSKLWPDIRVPGLPVQCARVELDPEAEGVYIRDYSNNGGIVSVLVEEPLGFRCPYHVARGLGSISLDLSRPGASDILARRVATATRGNIGHGAAWWYEPPCLVRGDNPHTVHIDDQTRVWMTFGHVFDPGEVPALASLDPADATRLDWGTLGSPRTVDLVALGIVAQHLYAQEQQ